MKRRLLGPRHGRRHAPSGGGCSLSLRPQRCNFTVFINVDRRLVRAASSRARLMASSAFWIQALAGVAFIDSHLGIPFLFRNRKAVYRTFSVPWKVPSRRMSRARALPHTARLDVATNTPQPTLSVVYPQRSGPVPPPRGIISKIPLQSPPGNLPDQPGCRSLESRSDATGTEVLRPGLHGGIRAT